MPLNSGPFKLSLSLQALWFEGLKGELDPSNHSAKYSSCYFQVCYVSFLCLMLRVEWVIFNFHFLLQLIASDTGYVHFSES